jgi:hypothetical protein
MNNLNGLKDRYGIWSCLDYLSYMSVKGNFQLGMMYISDRLFIV